MSGNAENPSDFDALLSELDTLAKSQPTLDDVKAIQGAAGEGGNDDDPDNDGDGEGDNDGDGDGDGQPMAKSFRVMGAGGEEIEAFDGGELIKGLMAQQAQQGEQMTKALTGVVSHIRRQDELLKSLIEQVAALGVQGRGRKSSVTVHDRAAADPLAKGGQQQPQGMTCDQVLAKASMLYQMGKGGFTSLDIAGLEARRNRGEPAPASMVERVLAAAS